MVGQSLLRFGLLTALLVPIAGVRAMDEPAGMSPSASAVSQSGLLPVYGIDLAVDPSWVDAASVPSQSPEHPHAGVNDVLQRLWEALKPGGYSVLRIPVDVRDPVTAANRTANLCLWAQKEQVKLCPVLIGSDAEQPVPLEFRTQVSDYVTGLLKALAGADGANLPAYSQILSFQIENRMNHPGRGMPTETALLRVLQAAASLRKAEDVLLKDTGLEATPLTATAALDPAMIAAGAIAGAAWNDESFAVAYEKTRSFLQELAAAPDVDLVGVEWFPGSLSAGGIDRFPALLEALTMDLAGKQVLLTTGCSTAFQPTEKQREFLTLAFTNLADYRTGKGPDSPFVGVIFHQALNGPEAAQAPPAPNLPAELAGGDWSLRAAELAKHWSGEAPSEAMAWWLRKVEQNMGVVSLSADAGTVAVTDQPGQQGLEQIATAVTEAAAAAPAPADPAEPGTPAPDSPAGVEALKGKLQEGLLGLLERVLSRLGESRGGEEQAAPPVPESAYTLVPLTRRDVSLSTPIPRPGQPVTVRATLRNASPDTDATGLVVALVDRDGRLLGTGTQTTVSVPAGQSRQTAITWAPTGAGSYLARLVVTDPAFTELSSVSLGTINVRAGGGLIPTPDVGRGGSVGPIRPIGPVRPIGPGSPIGPGQGAGAAPPALPGRRPTLPPPTVNLPPGVPQLRDLAIGEGSIPPSVGQPVPVVVSVLNPYSLPLGGVRMGLHLDGAQAHEKSLGTLLPGQSRTVRFPPATFSRAGRHEVKVAIQTASGASGFVSGQVNVDPTGSNAVPPQPPGGRPGVTLPGRPGRVTLPGRGAVTPVIVRPILPPRFSVGGVTLPVTTPGAGAGPDSGSRPGGVLPGRRPITSSPEPGAGAARPGLLPPGRRPIGTPESDPGKGAAPQRPGLFPPGRRPIGTPERDPGKGTAPQRPGLLPPGRRPIGAPGDDGPGSAPSRPGLSPGKGGTSQDPAGKGESLDGRPAVRNPGGLAPPPGVRGQQLEAPRSPLRPGAQESARPDLVVSSRDIRHTSTATGVSVSVRVSNRGTVDARGAAMEVALVADGRPADQQRLTLDVPAGRDQTRTVRLRPAAGRQIRIQVTVRVAGDAAEGNNSATVTLPPPPPRAEQKPRGPRPPEKGDEDR